MIAHHVSVLLDEVIQNLAVGPGDVVVDGTFGAGGYSRAILATGARVVAFDRDPTVRRFTSDLPTDRFQLVEGLFSQHARIKERKLAVRLDEVLDRVRRFAGERVPRFHAFKKRRADVIEAARKRLNIGDPDVYQAAHQSYLARGIDPYNFLAAPAAA